ncbi:PotD/PotF family extracellular solute-binding protein [Sporosarcina sp. HYO08]|uniref:ABC transporter substrate-binding protein n=1 Tax=Sporosarcina sp. HYO08 TaxID=1759557 RepID=UPI000795C87E|nr:ABC transporter substrate-binding protein [Sporosarcina sp. HYO08]KXH87008.1 ABC transporter substrate-binding protein [Sporosarcina sp. HYO08]
MKNKKIVKIMTLLLSLAVIFVFSGCANKKTADGDKPKLVVVNWKDHGSDSKEAIEQFEAICNCEVVHQYMASEEELLTQLRTVGPELDVVLPNSSILVTAMEEGLLEEIDTTTLENYQYLNEELTTLPEMSLDGKVYAIPWVWGSTSIAYNTELIDEEIDSIQVLFDEKYKGKLAIRDDFNDAVMIAAIALGEKDPNHPSDLDAIKQTLLDQKQLNKTYWKTGEEFAQLFSSEQISVALAWSGQSSDMTKEGQPLKYIVPKEGAIGWVDTWAIVKDSKNKEIAKQFIDFMISTEWQTTLAKDYGLGPANRETLDQLDPQFLTDNNMDKETLEKLHFISFHTDEEKRAWNDLWQEVKAR